MAWVRIHDGAMTHPKVIGLSDKAFRLWVWGLSYSQQHLTDGVIPTAALPSRLKRAIDDLVRLKLWDSHVLGFAIHDYLQWNDSKEVIVKKRSEARERMSSARNVREKFARTSTWVGLRGSSSEGVREREPWCCPHVDPCESPAICRNATILKRPVKVAS